MDHTEAIRLQAAAKYALGELSPEQIEAYEEHYFDCAECALDVKAVMAFADASCQVFREQDQQKELVPQAAAASRGWFAWLKPAFAVPAFAVLLLAVVVGYNKLNVVHKGNEVESVAALHVQPTMDRVLSTSFTIHESRGAANTDHVSVHSAQTFELKFDFNPDPQFSRYVGQLQDETGKPVLEFGLSNEMAQREVHVQVPAGLVHSANYKLVISGDPANTGHYNSIKDKQVDLFTFPVEILP